ncbi:hypothetical protein JZK55_03680 [Dissulfurispira thermophila]|uniref:Type I restriction modification DNA specificity domain-containing protein n=1 Tax=Dissulfurispira thermophila TaxID=2715679 RepID=A0A7G1GZY5_9BACT|nr:restriction endonuclease subunit S [Dissulfurispira thermophila]BCB95446.1 hypothetical protein JZK55_03680 [Dissulfurispira thermophila]
MITDLKPYPAYKDSGVEWLGEVPAHWEVRRLKNAARVIMGQSPSSNDCSVERIGLPFLQGCAEFGVEYPQPKQFCKAPSKVSPAGAILMSVRAPVGRLNTADQQYGIGRGLCAIVPHPGLHQSRFIRFGVIVCLDGLAVLSTGSTYDAVSVADVAGLRIPLPPLPEQTAIVRFLDWAEQRIRRVIRARQRRFKLLEEYKQALIHQAVTGRIDVRTGQPYPAYKDSGVDWLGEVPEHWEVRRLKNAARVIMGQSPSSNDCSVERIGLPFLQGCAEFGVEYPQPKQFCKAPSKVSPAGAILMSVRAPVGRLNTADQQYGIGRGLCAIVPHPGLHQSRFIRFGVIVCLDGLAVLSTGSTYDAVSVADVAGLRIPLPPLPEQTAIVEYLDAQATKINAAIAAARREIDLLREYRERLIADVVTGKLDVREVAEKLPDEPEEELELIEDEAEEKDVDEIDTLPEEDSDE